MVMDYIIVCLWVFARVELVGFAINSEFEVFDAITNIGGVQLKLRSTSATSTLDNSCSMGTCE